MPRIKRILQYLIAAFLIYAVITSPDKAASILSSAWQIVVNGVVAIGQFFDTLLGR